MGLKERHKRIRVLRGNVVLEKNANRLWGLAISLTNACNYRKLSGETTDKRGRMTMQLPCSGNLKILLLRRRITSAESLAGTNCAWPEDLHCNYKFVEQGEEYSAL